MLDLPAGSFAFSVPHDYTDNSVSRYIVGVTLDDGDDESAFAQTVVLISDPAPVFAAPGLVLSSSSIVEGGTVNVSGTITSPGGSDTNTVTLYWGDTAPATTITLAPGDDTFTASHTYLHNLPGVTSALYTIDASVTNQNQKAGFASASVTVNKAAPQFTAADLTLSNSIASEGDTITLSGTFTDPDAQSSYTTTIDWGDGSTSTTLQESLGQIVESTTTPGLYSYSATHEYLNNPTGEPTGGAYGINVSVSDGVNVTSAGMPIVVNNVAPDVQVTSALDLGAGTITVTANVTDPGVLDTETVGWTLVQNGIEIGTATGTTYTFPIPDPLGVLVATATVKDSDGAVGTDSAQMVVIYQTGASVVINPTGVTVSTGGNLVSTTTNAGAGQVIALVTGSEDDVDASAEKNPVELISYGSTETLLGGAGNDLLVAGSGANSVVGGGGDDTIVSNLGDDTLMGSDGNDIFRINPGLDPLVIDPTGFNTLDFSIATSPVSIDLALESGQQQIVNASEDVVTLEGQFDGLIASPEGGTITANDGDDLIYATSGNTTITGGAGHDSINGGSGNDIIYTTSGNSTITGGTGHDSIVGGSGNDIIYTTSGNTTITGGSGHDSIVGGTGNDIIYTTSGNSTITSGSGHDSITGGTGNDIIYTTSGNTTVTSGSGHDSIVGGSGNDIIYTTSGNSTITSGSGQDCIIGGTGNDIIYTTSGNSTITGGTGTDCIVGGSGNDIIYTTSGNSTITSGSGHDSITGGTGNDIIYTTSGNTTITGGSGTDCIVGGSGNDIIYTTSGNSTITGGSGTDCIVGGSGNDIIYLTSGNSTVTGGTGTDCIVGGSGNDIIYLTSGNSTVTGGSRSDSIVGGTGNDVIYLTSGNSTVTGGSGKETIVGGSGNDIIFGNNASAIIVGGSGDSTITGGMGDDIIIGGSGDDSITGGSGDDQILGGTGNDLIEGGSGNDNITGGSGNDTIDGGSGDDTITGGSGNDSISGGTGSDSIVGGQGVDIIFGGAKSGTITGGSGNDLIVGGPGNDVIEGGSGDNTIIAGDGDNSITGGSGDDIIYGGTGDNTISAGTGNSTISGGGGDDVLSGGGNDSWLMFYGATNVTLTSTSFSTSGGSLPDSFSTITGFEHAILAAGPGDFTLDASAFTGGGVMLIGGAGNDTLIGSSGPDTLEGGDGNDSLVGGGGNDTFAFDENSSGSQTVVEQPGTGVAGLDFSQAPAGVSINLSLSGPQAVIPGTLTLTLANPLGIDNVLGSAYDDTLIGNANDNTLIGAGGDDLIAGLGGDDVLEGGVTRTILLDFDTETIAGDHVYTQAERDAIQAQLTADYSAFSYTFTQTAPTSGPYTTIYFNDPTLTGEEGGSATGIDWRDLDISAITTLAAGGLEIIPGDTASVNVNSLLGQAGEPDATSADYVALSATIAAHELGHLSGLEHGDSYGPIGSGIYVGVNPDLYEPTFTGLVDASETVRHIMASGASVNTTLFDSIDDPFFGERESIKLAYGANGSVTAEQTAPHYSMADAQPITLAPLVVPDTDLQGVDADRVFDVTAADVVGELGLDSSGHSLTDYYSFTAAAGTLINFQVMSAVLNRPQGAFDTDLTIYNSSGQVIATNDNSFQDTDSTIIDLTLPSTGTYYAMVTSSANSTALNEPLTGAYELFMYTFATNGDPPAGDTMYGGSGIDTLIAGSADDTIAAQLPKDTIISGSGTATVLGAAPYLNVTAGPNLTVNEGDSVTLTGSFLDPFGNLTHMYDWHVDASSGQMIADGTGPSFTFSPGNAGTYTVTFTASDLNGGKGSAVVVITSDAVAPILTAPAAPQTAYSGLSATINLGTLEVKGVGPWTETVEWGDGQSSTFLPAGSGALSLPHTYATTGPFTVFEMVSEYDGDSVSASFQVNVTQASTSTVLSLGTPSAVYGQSLSFTATVTGAGSPTGTVAFYCGPVSTSDEIGSATLSLVNGLDVATITTKTRPVAGSPYAITAVYSGDTTHLGSTSNVATQIITQAPLVITVSSASKVYGAALPGFSATYKTFVNGDTAVSLTTPPRFSTTATTTSPVGTYTITAGGAVDSNYAITYVPGTLTINQDATTTTASVSSTGASLGQMITIAAKVIANAPGSGTPTGSVDFFDTTTGDDLGNFNLSSGVATLNTASLPPGSNAITLSYSGDSNFLTSTTTAATIVINQSIIILDPTASGALDLSGNASIKVAGGVYVDSSSASALEASGNAQVSASAIDVHGGVQKSGNASFNPAVVTKAGIVSDPLVGLPVPGTSGVTSYGAETLSGNSKATIKPGIYSSIALSGNASLTMDAGLYIIEGGGLQVSGNASVSGAGVTLYNAGSKFPNSGGSFGAISLSGNGTVKLSPSVTGSYADVLIIQPAANTQTLAFSGNAMAGVTGAIYAPGAELVESGNAQVSATIVVDAMSLSGNSVVNLVTSSAGGNASAGVTAQSSSVKLSGMGLSVSNSLGGSEPTDSVIDSLVASLLSSPVQNQSSADASVTYHSNKVTIAQNQSGSGRAAATVLSSVPAGPLAHLGWPRQTRKPANAPENLLAAGGGLA